MSGVTEEMRRLAYDEYRCVGMDAMLDRIFSLIRAQVLEEAAKEMEKIPPFALVSGEYAAGIIRKMKG